MKLNRVLILAGILCAQLLATPPVQAAVISNKLLNAGFESGSGGSNANWFSFGNAFRNSTLARSGTFANLMYGGFSGAWNYAGIYQDFPATNGQSWEASAWMYNWSSDPMQGSNYCFAQIVFYDSSGQTLWAVSSLDKLTAASPANVWTQIVLRSTAPRATVTARFYVLFAQSPANEAGAAWIDDCQFGLSTQTNGLRFAGLPWAVTEGEAYPGYPGPNLFSTNSAYVDTNGALHMRLTQIGTNWYSAQLGTLDTFGYGEYAWKLPGRPDLVNSNLVAGLFTYEPTKQGVWNEIDFEFTHAFDGMTESNLQFAIQPAFQVTGNSLRAVMTLSTNGSTHRFLWTPGDIRFNSYKGMGDAPANTSDVLATWVYAGTNQPVHSNETVFMNLYLWNTNAPSTTQDLELVVNDFTFTPFRGTLLSDNFDDSVRSNAWDLNGFEGGWFPTIQETNGMLGVAPPGDWLTAGYISTNPVNWNNRDAWTVFSARLTTIRVDTAVAGVDARAVLELASERQNAWAATNSLALFAQYDQASNRVTFFLASKTNLPSADGTERFRATLTNASSYMSPTGGIEMRLGVGRGQYRVELCNRQGTPLPVTTNSGAALGSHLCGEKLNHAYWLVGAMNEGAGRGMAFWERADAAVDVASVNWGSSLRYDRGNSYRLNTTNRRISHRVIASQNATVDKIYVCAGKKGATSTWQLGVQTNDALGRPAGAIIASATFTVSTTNMTWREVDVPNFTWIKGSAYHFVIAFTSGTVNATNYVDFPLVMTNTAGMGVLTSTSAVPSWTNLASTEPAFRVLYADGKTFAQTYATNFSSAFQATNRYGQRFTPDSPIVVSNITLLLRRDSSAGDVRMDLREGASAGLIASSLVASNQLATTNRWIKFVISPAVRVNQDVPYYFELRRASGTGNAYVMRQDALGAGDYSWGGTNACCISSANSGTSWVNQVQQDLGFFLNAP